MLTLQLLSERSADLKHSLEGKQPIAPCSLSSSRGPASTKETHSRLQAAEGGSLRAPAADAHIEGTTLAVQSLSSRLTPL